MPSRTGPKLHSPGRVFQQWLVDLTLAIAHDADGDWKAFAEVLPESTTVEKKVGCFTTNPTSNGIIQVTGRTLQSHGVEVLIQSDNEESGYVRAALIRDTVDDSSNTPANVTVETVEYKIHRASLSNGINRLGEDKQGRYSYSLNYLLSLTVDL